MGKKLAIVAAFAVVVLTCISYARAEVVIDTVTVGDPGNTPDDEIMSQDGTTGYGSVDYEYRIGKSEVTNDQYAEFLNAVAASDPHSLYDTDMSFGYGGIARSGSDGSFTYTAIAEKGDFPVVFVSRDDALRFANWMHNGQGSGDTEDGAYDMSLGADIVRKPGAQVFLPSEDEWYKAAYYKSGGIDAGYWDYPTQADDPPTSETPPGTDMVNGSANYDMVVGTMIDVAAYVGGHSGSAYDTFDQGGNVWEWNEAVLGEFRVYRGVRGGSFGSDSRTLNADYRFVFGSGLNGADGIGFRVAEASWPDLDGDGDVDLFDFSLFQARFAGDLSVFPSLQAQLTGPQ